MLSVSFGDVQAGKKGAQGNQGMVKQYLADTCSLLGHTGADLGAGLERAGKLERLNSP